MDSSTVSLTNKIFSLAWQAICNSAAGSPVGDYILFITLVKQSPQSDWLITEFGSGP